MSNDLNLILKVFEDKLTEANDEINLLKSEYPYVFEGLRVQNALTKFQNECTNAIIWLSKFNVSIATVGTTSSGKSTLVNALVGRRIAPIEADEMSGGILRLKHSFETELIIEKTQATAWEHGTWNSLEDQSIYRIVRSIMYKYNAKRKLDFTAPPQITVKGQLLAINNRSLLRLPDNIELEFLDLPGLKSVEDASNLEVIRSQISDAFLLITLDYLQTDQDNRSKLLKELENSIEKLGGRTDSMIFILNRVDLRGFDDEPLQKRIQCLKNEITTTLNLSIEPDILPLCARVLYYAQCAWGTTSLENQPNAPKDIQKHLVQALFKDCASFLEDIFENSSHFEDWSFKLKGYIRNTELDLNPEDLRHLLKGSLYWSGGYELWRKLQQRLHKYVIFFYVNPIIHKIDGSHKYLKYVLCDPFSEININTSFSSCLALESI